MMEDFMTSLEKSSATSDAIAIAMPSTCYFSEGAYTFSSSWRCMTLNRSLSLSADAKTLRRALVSPEGQEKEANERRKTLPAIGESASWFDSDFQLPKRAFSSKHYSLDPWNPLEIEGDAFFAGVPRSMSPLSLYDDHDKTASVHHQSLGEDIPSQTNATNAHEDTGSRLPPPPSIAYPYFIPPAPDSTSGRPTFRFDTSRAFDSMDEDPEALFNGLDFGVANTNGTDPSVLVTALIAALGLLSSHSSNPKVTVFQLSAAAVAFTLIALHSFHSKTLANTERHSMFVQRLLKYFPLLVFSSCWVMFLLGTAFTSPKVMGVTITLVVLASVPMVCGARLPAVLTLAIITLFGLTFFALVFLVCILPTEWLA